MKKIKYLFIALLLVIGACKENPTESPIENTPKVTPFISIVAKPDTIVLGATTNIAWATNLDSIKTNWGYNTTSGSIAVAPVVTTPFTLSGVKNGVRYTETRLVVVKQPIPIVDPPDELKIGNLTSDKKGIIISLNPNLIAAVIDQTDSTRGANFAEAIELCKNYGDGYHLPDSTELKLVKNAKDLGILTNFVSPVFAPGGIYISSTEQFGNTNWIFSIGMNLKNNLYGWLSKSSYANVRAVKSFQ
jgi:hypothetical protein